MAILITIKKKFIKFKVGFYLVLFSLEFRWGLSVKLVVIFLKLRLGLTKKVGADLVSRVHTLHKTMHMHIFDKYYFLSKKTILINPCLLPN